MAKIMVRVTTDLYPYYPTLTESFEKMMYNRMKDYIDRHNLLYSSQYGFCKVHSTQHAILDIVNAMQTVMNQGLFSCGVFIDLKKAFDTVDHNTLLDKLNHYGFCGIITGFPRIWIIVCNLPKSDRTFQTKPT